MDKVGLVEIAQFLCQSGQGRGPGLESADGGVYPKYLEIGFAAHAGPLTEKAGEVAGAVAGGGRQRLLGRKAFRSQQGEDRGWYRVTGQKRGIHAHSKIIQITGLGEGPTGHHI